MSKTAVKDKPLVSIIIPCYNAEKTIIYSLDSILKQHYDNYEIIIVDDGSNDATYRVTQNYQMAHPSKNIRLFSFDHRGVAHARNKGLDMATGEIIAFIDADDTWLPHKLQMQVQFLQTNPDVDMIFGDIRFLQNGKLSNDSLSMMQEQAERPTLLQLIKHRPIPLSTVAIRRSSIRKVGNFDCELESCEDYDLWYRLLASGVILAGIKEVIAIVRIRPDSLSADLNRYKRSMSSVWKKLLQVPQLEEDILKIIEQEICALEEASFPEYEISGRLAVE